MSIDVHKLAYECDFLAISSRDSLRNLEKFAALVLEQAAKKCEAVEIPHLMVGTTPESAWEFGTMECATAIRAMKPTKDQS